MDKSQAIHSFWSSFGLTAYDENTVPQNAQLPYITYRVSTDSIGQMVLLGGDIWHRSRSWEEISQKADEIAEAIGYGYKMQAIDGGYLWITPGHPFTQRMADPDPDIRRITILLECEFLTAY